ncbi:hypothetical protein [Pseudonocardia spinosispora]|uniref:hypothetical protein n=1 Tax=Pseudonocardia spinosispora TaxID=103441 RepID=UPI0004220689|nr:hypothetical protein [Pseudonocardia spinosispora]
MPIEPEDCAHPDAVVDGWIRGEPDTDGLGTGLPWEPSELTERDVIGLRARTTLGTCTSCEAMVVAVHTWGERGPTWHTRWIALTLATD